MAKTNENPHMFDVHVKNANKKGHRELIKNER